MIDERDLPNIYPQPGAAGYDDQANPNKSQSLSLPLANMFAVALILVLPTAFLVLLLNIFVYIFPDIVIVFGLFSWLGLIAAVTFFISRMTANTGIDIMLFYLIYSLCALPLSQFAYDLNLNISGENFQVLPLLAMILVANTVTVPGIVFLISTEKLALKSKVIIVIISVAACVGLTFVC